MLKTRVEGPQKFGGWENPQYDLVQQLHFYIKKMRPQEIKTISQPT